MKGYFAWLRRQAGLGDAPTAKPRATRTLPKTKRGVRAGGERSRSGSYDLDVILSTVRAVSELTARVADQDVELRYAHDDLKEATIALAERDAQLRTLSAQVKAQGEAFASLKDRLDAIETVPIGEPSNRRRRVKPSDALRLFLSNCTRSTQGGSVQARDLYLAWNEWCRIVGMRLISEILFARLMRETDIEKLEKNRYFYLEIEVLPKEQWATNSMIQADGGAA